MKVKLKLFFCCCSEWTEDDFCCLASFEKKRELHVMYEVFVAPIIFVKLRSPL